MKKLIAAIVMLCTVTIAFGEGCPQPVVKIKGPCPNPCPPAPACVCNPAPSVSAPPIVIPAKPEIVTVEKVIVKDRFVPMPVKRKGQFMLPLTAFKVGPTKGLGAGLGYQFRNRMILSGQVLYATHGDIAESTTTRIDTLIIDSDGDGTTSLPRHCTDGHGRDGAQNPHCQGGGDDDDPPPSYTRRVSSSQVRERSRDTGLAVTLTIPLGRR